MKGYFITDQGQVRSNNEDSGGIFYNTSGQLLAMVADGMGGHQAGEVASSLAVAFAEEAWRHTQALHTPTEVEAWLEETIQAMNQSIYEHSLENEAYEGMGTTVVVSICTEDFITIAHIGDSRAYLFSEHFKQLTTDHSLVNELVRTGQISKGDAEQHPRKNVLLRVVGTEASVEVDIETIGWSRCQSILLCSDGLTNKITDEELKQLFQKYDQPKEMAEKLIDLANERGGEDNITIAIVAHSCEDETGDDPC
jgi:protein phosphatase